MLHCIYQQVAKQCLSTWQLTFRERTLKLRDENPPKMNLKTLRCNTEPKETSLLGDKSLWVCHYVQPCSYNTYCIILPLFDMVWFKNIDYCRLKLIFMNSKPFFQILKVPLLPCLFLLWVHGHRSVSLCEYATLLSLQSDAERSLSQLEGIPMLF